jgi:D-proline reductase (dithiol) PrdB
LIAREVESRGIATVSLSSAWSITRAVNPPRAVFVDFPLGHTAGKRGDRALQRRIMLDALAAVETVRTPGSIRRLPYRWDDTDAWKTSAMGGADGRGDGGRARDDRVTRHDEPQYQYPEDRAAAERRPRSP